MFKKDFDIWYFANICCCQNELCQNSVSQNVICQNVGCRNTVGPARVGHTYSENIFFQVEHWVCLQGSASSVFVKFSSGSYVAAQTGRIEDNLFDL